MSQIKVMHIGRHLNCAFVFSLVGTRNMSTYKTNHGFTGCISGIFPQPMLAWVLNDANRYAVTMVEDSDGMFTVVSTITTRYNYVRYTSVGFSGAGGGEIKDAAWSTIDERRM